MRILVPAIYFLLLVSCSDRSNSVPEETDLTFTSDTITVISYKSRVEKLSYPVRVVGKIRSSNRMNMLFEQSGVLATVDVSSGSFVRRGEIIAMLHNENEKLTVENAKITLQKAWLDYESEMLALGDSLYYKERWPIIKQNVELNTGVSSARIALKQAQLAYNQTYVKAPFNGVIEGIQIEPGDYISMNQQIGSIYSPVTFEVICDVLEYDVLKIKKGSEAIISLLADKEIKLTGYVNEINPAIDKKGLSQVKIKLPPITNSIIPGLSVAVEINVTDEPTIVVPMKAVVKRSERHVVFNVDNGLAKWNYVTLGKNNGEKVQVLEGLDENMEIIISNNLQLAHDSPVKLE